MKKCPYCAEEIQDEAIKCKYCESILLQENLRKSDQESSVQRIAAEQNRLREKFKEEAGVDPFSIIPVIGQDIIKWNDIVRQVFRVLEFDRSDTIILANGSVKASSFTEPYGFLLVESPILNVKAHLPIVHRVDFLLAASVFDDSKLEHLVIDEELLVTYAPKHVLPNGLSFSSRHVLHYVITPRGTLDSYYSMNNDAHMAKPDPEKLFGPLVYPWFVFKDRLKVQVNLKPNL